MFLLLAAAVTIGCRTASTPAVQPAPTMAAATTAISLTAATDQFASFGNVRLRYHDIGRGQPVVLLHGLADDLGIWSDVADSLALDHRVIAFDERGFGKSTKFTEVSQFGTAMADDVIHLLDHLGISRAHVVGHSMGAVVAANVAARYPTRVLSTTLLAPPLYADSIAFERSVTGFVEDLEHGSGFVRMIQWLEPGTPDSLATLWSSQAIAANPTPTLVAVLRSMSRMMISARQTAALRTPTLIAVGTSDPLREQARWLSSWWPRAHLLEVPGVAHSAIVNRPEVLDAMRALMSERAVASLPVTNR